MLSFLNKSDVFTVLLQKDVMRGIYPENLLMIS